MNRDRNALIRTVDGLNACAAECVRLRAQVAALEKDKVALSEALRLAEKVWSGALAYRHGGTREEQREPVLNAIRATLAEAARRK